MSPEETKRVKLKQIYEALLRLLRDQPLTDITVAALCREAGVSRTYYYRNFDSYQTIITRFQELAMRNYLRRVPRKRHLNFSALMTTYFAFAADRAAQTRLLVQAGLTATLIDTFRTVYTFLANADFIDSLASARGRNPYFATYLAGAVVAIEVKWIDEGMRETPANMGAMLGVLFGFD